MITHSKLIFDLGANDGADTAYYLRLGYRVVAVEADPLMAEGLERRFSADIADGRVSVVNAAVLEEDRGTIDFFVSGDNTKSSLIPGMAERSDTGARQIKVRGRSLPSLFNDYGLPWYCKIDIEGADTRAVNGMSGYDGRPAYISCEGTSRPIHEIAREEGLLYIVLDSMASQGYRQFKLVDQESLQVLSDADHYDRLHRWPVRVRTKLERWLGMPSRRNNNLLWMNLHGLPEATSDSGAFGEQLSGEWNGYETTRSRMFLHFSKYYQCTKNKQLVFYVDIHAKY